MEGGLGVINSGQTNTCLIFTPKKTTLFTPSNKSYLSFSFCFWLALERERERWKWREGRITKGRALTCQEWVKRALLIGEGDPPSITNMVE
jgi:hypothetical protein